MAMAFAWQRLTIYPFVSSIFRIFLEPDFSHPVNSASCTCTCIVIRARDRSLRIDIRAPGEYHFHVFSIGHEVRLRDFSPNDFLGAAASLFFYHDWLWQLRQG